jgi:hypothetical protein
VNNIKTEFEYEKKGDDNMSLTSEIMAAERKVLRELGKELNEQVADSNHPYSYYRDVSYNLFVPMCDKHKDEFEKGSGGELTASGKKPAKMASIRSSSAMTFNLLGNCSVNFLENNGAGINAGEYDIEYEKRLKTIKKSNSPANLDAFLEAKDGSGFIFCEMKMLEWLRKSSNELAASYKDEHNYESQEDADKFPMAIDEIEKEFKNGTFKSYDVWQMFKHTVAIYNFMKKPNCRGKKVTLLNVVFEPDTAFMSDKARADYEERIKSEHKGFDAFRNALEKSKIIKSDFDVKYLSVKDFMDCIEMSDVKKRYLRRYTLERA